MIIYARFQEKKPDMIVGLMAVGERQQWPPFFPYPFVISKIVYCSC